MLQLHHAILCSRLHVVHFEVEFTLFEMGYRDE